MNRKIFFVTAEKSGNDIAFPLIKRLIKNGDTLCQVPLDKCRKY